MLVSTSPLERSVEIAAVDPEPDDRGGVPEHDEPDGGEAEGAATVPPHRDGRQQRLGQGSERSRAAMAQSDPRSVKIT